MRSPTAVELVLILILNACGSFGAEEAETATPAQVSTAAPEPPPSGPTTTEPALQAVAARHWHGSLPASAPDEHFVSTLCSYRALYEDVSVDVTADATGEITGATVTATAREENVGTCVRIVEEPEVHSFSFVKSSDLSGGLKQLDLERAKPSDAKISLVIEGRFDQPSTEISLRWERKDVSAFRWRLDAKVACAETYARL